MTETSSSSAGSILRPRFGRYRRSIAPAQSCDQPTDRGSAWGYVRWRSDYRPLRTDDAALTRKLSPEELAAAQAVQRVLGGTWRQHDTGMHDGMFDVLHTLADKRRVALEVTSEGTYDTRKSRDAISKRTAKGDFDGPTLSCMWNVTVYTNATIAKLDAVELEATLRDFEAQDIPFVHTRGAHPWYGDPAARALLRLGVDSTILMTTDPPSDEPKIVFTVAFDVVAGPEALPNALSRVLERGDNQRKLDVADDVDERHLYVRLHDRGASAALYPVWTIPPCPSDPDGVVDTVWVYAPLTSPAYLHRVTPGTADWQHYVVATGELVPESVLRES